jgi:hypothetical protein
MSLGMFERCNENATIGHESLATTQKYLEPSKETEKQLEAMKLPF